MQTIPVIKNTVVNDIIYFSNTWRLLKQQPKQYLKNILLIHRQINLYKLSTVYLKKK